jgi:hypothetical protein
MIPMTWTRLMGWGVPFVVLVFAVTDLEGFPEESEKFCTLAWPWGSEGRNFGQVGFPAGKMLTDHAVTLKQEPLIRPGTPDPYQPPKAQP